MSETARWFWFRLWTSVVYAASAATCAYFYAYSHTITTPVPQIFTSIR